MSSYYIYQKELVQSVIQSGMVDHLIVNNEFMKLEIHNENNISLKDISVIHHHWDPRISTAQKENQSNLTFGFLGSVAALSEIWSLSAVSFDRFKCVHHPLDAEKRITKSEVRVRSNLPS